MTDWMDHAVCKGLAVNTFFPAKGDSRAADRAKLICAECPVTEECLDFAARENFDFGIWGGEGKKGIRRRRRELKIQRKSASGIASPGWAGKE